MSKKKKENIKKRQSGFADTVPMKDMLAERHFKSQLEKAVLAGTDGRYEEALEILIPLTDKYNDRFEFVEIIALACLSLGKFNLAEVYYERLLEIAIKSGKMIEKAKYLLAKAYLKNTSPFLTEELLSQINVEKLERQHRGITQVGIRKLQDLCAQEIAALASSQSLSVEEFTPFGKLMESGFRVFKNQEITLAIQNFEEASRLQPQKYLPFLRLAGVYTEAGQEEKAFECLRHILENLDADNFITLVELVALLISNDQKELAVPYFNHLQQLPVSENIMELVRVLALLDKDQEVYDMVSPFYTVEVPGFELVEDNDALVFAVVSAANLGKRDQALGWLEKMEGNKSFELEYPLLTRTWRALKNDEDGPLENDRFAYFSSTVKYFPLMQKFKKLLLESSSDDDGFVAQSSEYLAFLNAHSDTIQEILSFLAWDSDDAKMINYWLQEMLLIENPSGEEILKRFVFTKSGGTLLRLVSLATLIREGFLPDDTPVTIWLEGEMRTGVFEEIVQQLSENAN